MIHTIVRISDLDIELIGDCLGRIHVPMKPDARNPLPYCTHSQLTALSILERVGAMLDVVRIKSTTH